MMTVKVLVLTGVVLSLVFCHWSQVKIYGRVLPETIEHTLFSFGGVDARGRWRRGEEGVRGLSEQCILRCDQTRSREYRLETSAVTRVGANAKPTNKKKKT